MNNFNYSKLVSTYLVALISFLALCFSAIAGSLGDRILGTYQGEIWSSGKAMPGSTRFSLNKMGQTIGTYTYVERAVEVHGKLFNCLEKTQKLKLVCKWKDKYGIGMLEMDFSNDFTRFDGYWKADGSSIFFPWNGSTGKTAPKKKKKKAKGVVSGTGWPVVGGFVVTNHHVVAGHKKIVLLRQDGMKIPGSVAMEDATNDLVLIRVKDASQLPPALPLATAAAHAGARVFTIGYPHPDFMGSEPKVTDGLISAVTGLGNDPRTYQISVPLQAGNSGGPLLNMNGEVVGITTSKLRAAKVFKWTGDLPQNVNYAIKTGYLTMLLSSVSSSHKIPVLPARPGNVEQLAARIEKSVLIVIAQ